MRLAAAAAAVTFGAIAVIALRDATLSTHQSVDPHSRIEVVIHVRSHGREHAQTVAEMGSALVLACRLEVNSDPIGSIEDLGGGRFRSVLQPSMDRTDRRQFRGCLEDWKIDQFQLDVIRLAEISRTG